MNGSLSGRVKSVLIVIGIVAVVVFFTFPVYWMVTTAFKIRIDTIDPGKWLFAPTLENFRIVLRKRNFYAYLGNSRGLRFRTLPFREEARSCICRFELAYAAGDVRGDSLLPDRALCRIA